VKVSKLRNLPLRDSHEKETRSVCRVRFAAGLRLSDQTGEPNRTQHDHRWLLRSAAYLPEELPTRGEVGTQGRLPRGSGQC
jgi:hypothetical protein